MDVERRKCISPIAVEESIYVYAVEDDIWMQITGEGNIDVEKMYNAYEVEKVIYIALEPDASPKLE